MRGNLAEAAVVALLLWAALLQPAESGSQAVATINGRPVDASQVYLSRDDAVLRFWDEHGRPPRGAADEKQLTNIQEASSCGQLRDVIQDAARQEQLNRVGGVTSAELERARQTLPRVDPQMCVKLSRQGDVLLPALAAVDKGENPKQVYERGVKGRAVDDGGDLMNEQVWESYVRQWSIPEYRAKLQRKFEAQRHWTAQTCVAAEERMIRRTATNRKLEAFIDEQIGARDPRFRAHIREWRDPLKRTDMLADERQYIAHALDEWWKQRVAELHVILTDPSLDAKCGQLVREIGVRLPASSR